MAAVPRAWWPASGARGGLAGSRPTTEAALTSGVGSIVRPIRCSNRIKFISNGFKFDSNFDRSKMCLPVLQKLEVKYGWKELEIKNNFPYRNFSRFEKEFELKFRELL
jgi:hypothetical protein